MGFLLLLFSGRSFEVNIVVAVVVIVLKLMVLLFSGWSIEVNVVVVVCRLELHS